MKSNYAGVAIFALIAVSASAMKSSAATFGEDTAFLAKHTALIVLSDRTGQAKVAVAPAWQGRVMTSTAGGDASPRD